MTTPSIPAELADLAIDGLLLVREGRVRYANAAARSLLQVPLDGALLRSLVQPVPVSSSAGARSLPTLVRMPQDGPSGDGGPVFEAVATACDTAEGPAMAVRLRALEPAIETERARLQQLEAGIESAVDAIYLINPHTFEYLFVNKAAARLHGISREEMMARGMFQLWEGIFTRENRRRFYDELIARSPEPMVESHEVVRPDGTVAQAENVKRAVWLKDRWVVVSVIRDVTERERAQQEIRRRMEELTRSNRELEQFAYIISHDLSEPLRMMTGFAHLVKRRLPAALDQDSREFVEYIVEGGRRMKRMINDLLVYSRAGHSTAVRLVSLDACLDDALFNLAFSVQEVDAQIEREPLPELVADPSAMVQVLQNLIGNALKFRRGARPSIRIWAAEEAHCWRIGVTDNGIGIADRDFERIFVMFQRLHAPERFEGNGVGLAICKRIVEGLGGAIAVKSGVNEGSEFSFTLPKAAPAAPGAGTWRA